MLAVINEFGVKVSYIIVLFFGTIAVAGTEVQRGSVRAGEANAVHPPSC